MTESDLPQPSRSRRWLYPGLVLGIAVVAGIVLADLALSVQGPRYAATVTVRPLIDNPACAYTACPNQIATAGGYQWIISQADLARSKVVAARVHRAIKGAPSVATLMSNVRAKENNNSDSIDITYTGRDASQAQTLAVSFAQQYNRQTGAEILAALKDPTSTTSAAWQKLIPLHLTRTPRGLQLMNLLNTLQTTNTLAGKSYGPPGAPIVYAQYPSLVPVQRTTPGIVRATLLGAAAGLVVGLALLLGLAPRRPHRPHLRRRRTAVAGEA